MKRLILAALAVSAVLFSTRVYAEDPAPPPQTLYPFVGSKTCYQGTVKEFTHDEMGLIDVSKPTSTRTLKACLIVYTTEGNIAQFSIFFPTTTFVSWGLHRTELSDEDKKAKSTLQWESCSTNYNETNKTGVAQAIWVQQFEVHYTVTLWLRSNSQGRTWAVVLHFYNNGTFIPDSEFYKKSSTPTPSKKAPAGKTEA
jgi:hypothetical protein